MTKLDKNKELRLKYARVLKEIKHILVDKGYEVRHIDIEKLPEFIAKIIGGSDD